MNNPIQITFREMHPSAALEEIVKQKADKLAAQFGPIQAVSVAIEAPHRAHKKGGLYAVRLDVRVPGAEFAARSESTYNHAHEDVHVAVRDAFAAASRQLEVWNQRRRAHAPPTRRA